MGNRANLQVGKARMLNMERSSSPLKYHYVQQMNAQLRAQMKALQKVVANIRATTPDALEYAAFPIYQEAERLCPKDTGALMSSGFSYAVRIGTGVSLRMGFGANDLPEYAAEVHEDLETPHKAPTQAKFLTTAIQRKIGGFRKRAKRQLEINFSDNPFRPIEKHLYRVVVRPREVKAKMRRRRPGGDLYDKYTPRDSW